MTSSTDTSPTRRGTAVATALLLCGWALAASAQTKGLPAYVPPENTAPIGSPAFLLLRTLASLALVVGLIAGTAWLVKLRGGVPAGAGGQRLRALESLSLGTGRALHLVAVGGRVLLLGADGSQVSLLREFEAAEVGFDPEAPGDSGESFLARLQLAGGRTPQAGR